MTDKLTQILEEHAQRGHAMTMLAADNARLCDILLAADRLAEVLERAQKNNPWREGSEMKKALDAYRVVRDGH